MTEKQKLPWPGYRVRDGWRMLEVGETGARGDAYICKANPPLDGWIIWINRPQKIVSRSPCCYFRRTRPDAEMPPVEPISAEEEPTDESSVLLDIDLTRQFVRQSAGAWVSIAALFASLESERDELRKQVETLTATCESLEMEKAGLENTMHRMQSSPVAPTATSARDWRSELRPCWIRKEADAPWLPALFHRWIADADGSVLAIAELEDGTVFCTWRFAFKEPQS